MKMILPIAVSLVVMFLAIGIIPRRLFSAMGLSDLAVGVIVIGLAAVLAYLSATWVDRWLKRR